MNRLRTSSTRNSLVPEALQMRGKSMQRMFTRRRRSVVGEYFFLFHFFSFISVKLHSKLHSKIYTV